MDSLLKSDYYLSVKTESSGLPTEKVLSLLERIANHDSAAFQRFYAAHAGLLYATIYRVLNNHEDAQDVLQEVSLQIWMKAGLYEPTKGKPLTWITTMARNRAIDRLRAKKRRYRLNDTFDQRLGNEDRVTQNKGLDNLEQDEIAVSMRQAVSRLNPEQRKVIELTYFEGLTQAEAAQRLKEPLGTVKARIRRGILKLRSASVKV